MSPTPDPNTPTPSPIPRVSVIIPSYNHAQYLRACVESVRSQTLCDWEIIIVDDGSQDASVDIAKDLANEDTRIRVFVNQVNLGTYGTEQRALRLSTAPYIAVMNSDDLWARSKLERQVVSLEADPTASFCYVLGTTVDENGTRLEEDLHGDWPRSDPQELLHYLLSDNRILASGVLFRRETLRFDPTCRYSGDWVALLEQSLLGRARCIDERLVFWRQHDTNSYRRSIQQTVEEIRVRKAIHDARELWSVRNIPPDEVRSRLAMNAMHLIPLLVYVDQIKLARHFGWFAVRNHSSKPAALKRTLSLYLGVDKARTHFWSKADLAIVKDSEHELSSLAESLPVLRFKGLA